MTEFTPVESLLGGILIGLSGGMLLLTGGRIAGISGIVGGLLAPFHSESPWRLAFVVGLIGASVLLFMAAPQSFATTGTPSPVWLATAGLLVGIGTRLGSGCTSGHGVCGLARFSQRSLIATLTFIVTGALTVLLMRGAS